MKYVFIGAFKGVLPYLIMAGMLAGCNGLIQGVGVKSYDAKPAVFVKEGFDHDTMVGDSVDCQDQALASNGHYDSYVSSSGYTEDEVRVYDACMVAKGYKSSR